ncbi:MAG: GreA/GreB family elongation factor [Chlamydiales bacterium]|nr:GreA/GreB family elongation factor [Chlamydiales bacterium]
MSYLEEFTLLIEDAKLANFLRLWEEYCMADHTDADELNHILRVIKNSTLSQTFGQFAETVLTLWQKIEDPVKSGETLRLVLDLQTTNSPLLADLATDFLKRRYGEDKHFNEKLRIVGLLTRRSFQGAISNYELLTHMDIGKFVFHSGGWGVGEVMDISILREHVVLEFEGITALKDLSFDNAFKNLIPLPSEHFLSRRFGNPDALEKEGKEDPIFLIRLLLKDLGPKTAQEIKEELCELVIPESDWQKWWGAARAKIKKDVKIKSPKTAREAFILREEGVPHEVRFKDALKETKGIDEQIQVIYNFTRDFPEVLKNLELKQQIKTLLLEGLEEDDRAPDMSISRKIQITYLLEEIFPSEFPDASASLIKQIENIETILNLIEIVAFKKRTLTVLRAHRSDWGTIFLHLLFTISQGPIRDYIFKELDSDSGTQGLLKEKIHELLNKMTLYPEAFFWYFQKIASGDEVPYSDQIGRYHFFEALLIMLHFVEDKPEQRELAKKIHQLLLAKRYAVVRKMIEGASVEYLREFLLLASKCQSFTKHDLRIFQNLAEVVRPELGKKKKEKKEEVEVIWTTQEGYQKIQERIQHIGTVETVDNAREIEAARALGDLRENAEYKYALERRSRLQAELKTLTQQLNKARILTREDIATDKVSVGAIVNLMDSKGKKITYTLLGPWDADPDQHVLSFQSKLAQAMIGHKEGESFDFQGEHYTVKGIKSYLS